MNAKMLILSILLVFTFSSAVAQTGHLTLETVYFNNVEVFYIADFDFNNGMNNPDIFEYALRYEAPDATPGEPGSGTPIRIAIEFEIIANVPSLGLDNRRIIYIRTLPFDFNGEVAISTKNLDLNMDNIYYTDGREVTGIHKDEFEFIPEEEFTQLQTAILSGLKLPAGDYIFNFAIYPENSSEPPLSETQVISVGNPSDLELVSPGGALEDNIEIYSIYPMFQWESTDFMWTEGNCDECGYFIRVSEYNRWNHSSIEEALNDKANLPYPDNGRFYQLPSVIVAAGAGRGDLLTADNTFQFPFTDAKPLEEGKTYVWQIRKVFPTTSGSELLESDIFAFTIPSMGGDEESGTASGGSSNMYLQIMEQIIDADTYNALFSGELEGFLPTGVVTLNDTQQLTQDQLSALAAQVLAGQISIKSISVE